MKDCAKILLWNHDSDNSFAQDVGSLLEIKAKTDGKGLTEYVETLITAQAKRPTFRELFADVRESITVSDDDLLKEIDAAMAESRGAKAKK